MAEKHAVGYVNHVDHDDTVLTADAAASGTPVSNLQLAQLKSVHRTPAGTTAVALTLDFGSAKAWRAVLLAGTNLTSAATWRIRAADTEADLTAAPAVDSGSISAWPAAAGTTIRGNVDPLYIRTAADRVTRRWLRIDVTDAAAVVGNDSRLELGRLAVLDMTTPAHNYQFPERLGVVDRSGRQTTDGLQLFTRAKPGARVCQVAWLLTRAEMRGVAFDLDQVAGVHTDVLYVLSPDDTDHYHREVFWGPQDRLDMFERVDLDVVRRSYVFVERL